MHKKVAVEPRFCRRLASPETVDLLVVLALGTTPKNKSEYRGAEEANGWKGAGGGGGGGEGRKSKSSRLGNGGDHADSGGSGCESQDIATKLAPAAKRYSGERVNVATPYVGALRYCVVTIVERLGSILDEGGEFERTSSTLEMTSIVVSIVKKDTSFKINVVAVEVVAAVAICDGDVGIFWLVSLCRLCCLLAHLWQAAPLRQTWKPPGLVSIFEEITMTLLQIAQIFRERQG